MSSTAPDVPSRSDNRSLLPSGSPCTSERTHPEHTDLHDTTAQLCFLGTCSRPRWAALLYRPCDGREPSPLSACSLRETMATAFALMTDQSSAPNSSVG